MLGVYHLNSPITSWRHGVLESIMELPTLIVLALLVALPKLEILWDDSEAAPVRPWHLYPLCLDFVLHCFHFVIEHSLVWEYLALWAGPGTDLTAHWSGVEILIILSISHFLGDAFDPDLPVGQRPVE